jgi:hypothetical protein
MRFTNVLSSYVAIHTSEKPHWRGSEARSDSLARFSHPSVHRAALQLRKQWMSGSYSSPCAKSDSCRERCSRELTRGALSTGAGCPRVSDVWFFVLIVWSTGRQTTLRKMATMANRHLGHYFCILAWFTRSKRLLSSERQKSKLSPAGSGSKNRTFDHLASSTGDS